MQTLVRYLPYLLGMACWWAMPRAPYLGFAFGFVGDDGYFGRLVFDICVLAIGLVGVFAARSGDILFNNRKALAVAGCASSMVGLACLYSYNTGLTALVLPGSVLIATGYSLFSVLWFVLLCRIQLRSAYGIAIGALLISMLAIVVEIPAINALLPATFICPVVVAVAIWCCRVESEDIVGLPQGEDVNTARLRLIYFIAALVLVEVITCCVVRGLWAHGGVGYEFQIRAVYTYSCSAIVFALALVLVAIIKDTRFISVALGGCGLLLVLGGAFGASLQLLDVFPMVMTAGFTLLLAVIFPQLVEIGSIRKKEAGRGAFAFVFVNGIASIITYHIVPALISAGASEDPATQTIVCIAGIAILTAGFGVGLFAWVYIQLRAIDEEREHPSITVVPMPADTAALHEEAVAQITETYGLSAREAEVVSGLSKGHTVKRIADDLYLSQSTVQGYCRSAYRKLGVHKKQEIIDLVNTLLTTSSEANN